MMLKMMLYLFGVMKDILCWVLMGGFEVEVLYFMRKLLFGSLIFREWEGLLVYQVVDQILLDFFQWINYFMD
jgi:hypothetical protein